MDPRDEILSGFREQSVHLYAGLGIFGAVRHGIIGMKIDITRIIPETIPEDISLFFSCMFGFGDLSL